MILIRIIFPSLISCLFISMIFPVEYTNYDFEIFSLSIDARTSSLGGIPTLESMSLNRAYSLNQNHNVGKSLFSYGQSFSGVINYFEISRIILESKKTRIGVSLLHKKIEDIPNTQDAWTDLGYDISQSDINYSNISFYSDQQIAMILLYSYNSKVGDVGFKIKPFYTSILEYNSFGFSSDLGITKYISDDLIIGLSINNLFSINKWSTGKAYSLYRDLHSLLSYSKGRHLVVSEFSTSLSKLNDILVNSSYKIGYENNIYREIKIQIGYSSIKSFSMGFSFEYNDRNFSYSFNPNFNNIILGHDHQFSILLDLPYN